MACEQPYDSAYFCPPFKFTRLPPQTLGRPKIILVFCFPRIRYTSKFVVAGRSTTDVTAKRVNTWQQRRKSPAPGHRNGWAGGKKTQMLYYISMIKSPIRPGNDGFCRPILGQACKRCGHRWYPRSPARPKVCPRCMSPYWDVERRCPKKEAEPLHPLSGLMERQTKDLGI